MRRILERRYVILAFLMVGLGLFSPAQPAALAHPMPTGARGQCLSLRSRILGHPVAYCVLLPPSYDADKSRRYPVLYYFHGLGDNEQMFLHSDGWNLIEDLWDGHQIGEFLIVTPAAGASFYINSRDDRVRYEDFLLQEFLPYIESHYRIRPGRANRGVAGFSMGGYGALRLAFLHPDLFASVSVHSAALIEKLPALTVDNSPGMGRLRLLGDVFGSPPDRAFWDRNNPLILARTANLARLNIYFDCGSEDDYGFNVGAQALHDLLVSRHIPHEFHIYPGGHTVSYFAGHLPASLEFQSRMFGLSPPTSPVSK